MRARTSFLLLSYNSAATIEAAVQAALAQECEPLDIFVSDDCSTDKSFEIIERTAAAYSGPHGVRCNRNSSNLGLLGNLRSSVALCEGELIVIAAGDDLSRADRARRLTKAWEEGGCPSKAVVYSDVRPIDAKGEPVTDWSEWVARPPWTLERLAEGRDGPLGAACAITPCLIGEPGPIDASVRHEDRVFPFRAMLLGGAIIFVDDRLLDYRVEGGMSRIGGGDRYYELTAHSGRRLTNMLSDAHQRLADAMAVNAPTPLIRLCHQVIAEQKATLAMSDGRALAIKAARAIAAGARSREMLKHLARFGRARAERLMRGRS
jgi:glycosyltransferase involved in cell wall biosynthesis